MLEAPTVAAPAELNVKKVTRASIAIDTARKACARSEERTASGLITWFLHPATDVGSGPGTSRSVKLIVTDPTS
jgi:hypothetical protein